MNQFNPNLVPIALLLLSIFVFFRGLKKAKLVRRMADTPLSKIASASIGEHVEIKGQIVCMEEEKVTSPLSNMVGAVYIWDFQKWEITKKRVYDKESRNIVQEEESGKWRSLFYYYSRPFLYLSDDSEGIAVVDLPACEFQEGIFNSEYKFEDGIPEYILSVIDPEDEQENGFPGKFRIRERVWGLNETLFIHGTAYMPPESEFTKVRSYSIKTGKIDSGLSDKINFSFDKLKQREDIVQRFDANQDGTLDEAELVKLKKAVEKKVLEKKAEKDKITYLAKSKVFFSLKTGPKELMNLEKVYLSTQSEEVILPKLRFRAYGAQFLGAILFAYGAYLMVSK